MSVVQITNATALIRAALAAALAPLVATYQGQPKAFWYIAPELVPPPLLVYQVQSPPQDTSFLNGAAASAVITVKALVADTDPAAAESLLATVPAALAGLTISGYSVRALWVRDVPPFIADFLYTAGLVYQLDLYA